MWPMKRWAGIDLRAAALFVLGAALLIWDVMISTPGELSEALLVLYAAMLGLPFMILGDVKRNERNQDKKDA